MMIASARQMERGFTYLGVLIAIAVLGVGLLAATEVWVTTARRQKLEQLEWVGAQFTQAIASYYETSPGSVKTYPGNLNDLLEDRRFLNLRRHLRMVYTNPFTGEADWDVMAGPDGRIHGVRAHVDAKGGETREFVYAPQ